MLKLELLIVNRFDPAFTYHGPKKAPAVSVIIFPVLSVLHVLETGRLETAVGNPVVSNTEGDCPRHPPEKSACECMVSPAIISNSFTWSQRPVCPRAMKFVMNE